MEGNLGFGEGNSAKKKDKNEKFYFAKVEALVASTEYDIPTSHRSAFVCWVKCPHHIWL